MAKVLTTEVVLRVLVALIVVALVALIVLLAVLNIDDSIQHFHMDSHVFIDIRRDEEILLSKIPLFRKCLSVKCRFQRILFACEMITRDL